MNRGKSVQRLESHLQRRTDWTGLVQCKERNYCEAGDLLTWPYFRYSRYERAWVVVADLFFVRRCFARVIMK